MQTYDGHPGKENRKYEGRTDPKHSAGNRSLYSGLNLSMADNAGDPFAQHEGILNSLDFEREVIETFGPLYGFDLSNLWGIVTLSGTDGNNHGIYSEWTIRPGSF
ncbi:MAG: hypothetical protein LIV11_10235 [Bacillota bacterium]|nr:hypothetical protein [Bacillota bacterium]